MANDLVEVWRAIIRDDDKSWVLFQNGTCVVLAEPEDDLAAQATAIMREWGPVHVGSPAGDFSVVALAERPGWVVTCHHPDVLTYVGPGEVGPDPSEVLIGLVGRGKRNQDAEELTVLHVEDRRGAVPRCPESQANEVGSTMPEVINFYGVSDEHGHFSNFSPHPVRLKGKLWPTSEHYFQAQKFAGTEHEEAIRQARSPMVAARMGRDRKKPLRPDWEAVKDDVMREAVQAKFAQHAELREALLATGDARLVEHTTNDSYWGDGGDGTGKNMLGRILMEIRLELGAGG